MRLGSLFDGSGGFSLAASMCGITPVWASEIEPYPIRVTTARFPNMKHLGDITKINGAEIEPVDIISFGSPCQDLSIAGKQKGLVGERSGLFMEAIRIIKEMRIATNGKYPTFIIWENVPGAYSSNKGEDFRTVLEEICKVADSDVSIPRFAKWKKSGEIVADGFSVAWRTLDAQYWGVPQRRKRIFLVGDFRGQRAGKILFERDGLQRDFKTGKETRERIAADAKGDSFAAVYDARGNGGGKISPTITGDHNGRISDYTAVCIAGNTIDRQEQNGGNGIGTQENISYTLNTIDRHAVMASDDITTSDLCICMATQQGGAEIANNLCPTITAAAGMSGNNQPCVYIAAAVRRLTPLECCRLQGFPDWWTYDTAVSDSARYKMWGNGLALPCALYVMEGVAKYLTA